MGATFNRSAPVLNYYSLRGFVFSSGSFWRFFGPVLEFLLFFACCVFVVLSADAVCYLVKHRWPATHVLFEFLGALSALWMIGGTWPRVACLFRGSEKTADENPRSQKGKIAAASPAS
jgi:hypothetical protein